MKVQGPLRKNLIARAHDSDKKSIGRRAFHMRKMVRVTYHGVYGKANVGISNDKEGKIPSRRKTKVSRAMSIIPGLVGS